MRRAIHPRRTRKLIKRLTFDGRVSRKWPSRFESLDHGAEIDRLRIERFPFRDLSAIQYLEPIALEQLFAPPVFKGNDLAVNVAFAETIKVTQVGAHQRTGGGDFSRVR